MIKQRSPRIFTRILERPFIFFWSVSRNYFCYICWRITFTFTKLLKDTPITSLPFQETKSICSQLNGTWQWSAWITILLLEFPHNQTCKTSIYRVWALCGLNIYKRFCSKIWILIQWYNVLKMEFYLFCNAVVPQVIYE